MIIERFFNEDTNVTIQDIIQSLIEEKIDSLIEEYYYQDKVNTTTSHVEGKKVS
jgi:ferritin-like protein